MPALKPTAFTARITWLGHVPGALGDQLRAEPTDHLTLGLDGPADEAHAGRTRPSCSRVLSQHPERGTPIANVRQLSVLSAEELALIAADAGLDRIDPAWLGASMVIEGIPDFTHVPPASRLQGPDRTTLVIDMENRPCVLPGREIDKDRPGHGPGFKAAARNRRGVTAWVERPGTLRLGEAVTLHIPDQPVWPHLAQARSA
ncbi:MOSC domain-containing protein [Actibacterium ureilyticum]|uniref:MOSC domain-containing protein n=1 Tax=Actibacterium ureilyticum TaxID=1590614 RepID=UPI000BAAACA7|nr:MOSC domain-containing protein [Actibacterium ureilyticum]